MKVAAFACIVLAFVCVFARASLAQEIVAASFTDGTCNVTKTHPQTLQSGQCVYSSDFNFYYTVKAGPNNTANYFYGCEKDCAASSCTHRGSGVFGACVSISLGNATAIHVSVFRVETQDTINVQVFTDAQCGQQITDYGTLVLDSGRCHYVDSIKQYLMVSHVNPNDAPVSRQLAYRALCNADCTSCGQYGRTELSRCTAVANVWVKANLATAGTSGSSEVTLKVWAFALIIVGSAVGGALSAFLVSGCVCCIWRARRHRHHNYAAINHH